MRTVLLFALGMMLTGALTAQTSKFSFSTGMYSGVSLTHRNSSFDQGMFTRGSGLGVRYAFSPKWSIRSGVGYMYFQQGRKAYETQPFAEVIDFTSPVEESSVWRERALEIPLSVQYNILDGLYVFAGGSAWYSWSRQWEFNYTFSDDSKGAFTENLGTDLDWMLHLGFGVNVFEQQAGKFSLYVEPVYRFGGLPQDGGRQAVKDQIGLQIGLKF